jgi:hypothetical protein
MAPFRGRLLAPLLPAGLVLALAGCSGTPFGDTLSRSFSAPAAPAGPAPAANPAEPTKPARAANPARAAKPANPASPSPPVTPAPTAAAAPAPATPAQPRQAPAAAPAPYRVTLQLPGADPAAPAEAVTRALRAAGVSFEVETIERLTPANAQAGNASRPGAPVVRPAPNPR